VVTTGAASSDEEADYSQKLSAAARQHGWHLRLKLFDYGVFSFALSKPFKGSWTDLVAAGQSTIDNAAMERQAEHCCRRAIDRLGIIWKRPRHELALRPETWRQSKGG
jgi:hypothetical protein